MNKIIAFLSAFCLYAGNSAAQSTLLLPGSEGALGACRADERKQTSELFGMKVAVVQTISPLKNGGLKPSPKVIWASIPPSATLRRNK